MKIFYRMEISIPLLFFEKRMIKMKESEFQKKLKSELKKRFPDCIILKNDASYIQGIPDLIVLWKKHWGTLECKRDELSSVRPNQKYYVEKMNEMSFSSFISPKTMEVVLDAMEKVFRG